MIQTQKSNENSTDVDESTQYVNPTSHSSADKTLKQNPIIPIAVIQFCAISAYAILRQLKDALIMSSMGKGYLFGWIKVISVTPASIFFTYMLNKLRNNSQAPFKQDVFSKILLRFIYMFIFFGVIVFPFHDVINFPQLPAYASKIAGSMSDLPSCLQFIPKFIEIILSLSGYWSFVLLYAIAEVWGSAAISVVAWGTANSFIDKKKTSSLYPLISAIANIGLWIASDVMDRLNMTRLAKDNPLVFKFAGSGLMIGIVCMVVTMLYSYRYIIQNFARIERKDDKKQDAKQEAKNMNFKESIQKLWSHLYLRNIAVMVISYNVAIACIDATWKDRLMVAFGNDAGRMQSKTNKVAAIISISLSSIFYFIGPYIPWITKSMLTLIMMGITTLAFFTFTLFGSKAYLAKLITGVFKFADPVKFIAIVGSVQNAAVKSVKYTLFDASKEQAFRAGGEYVNNTGKSIVDVVCSRLSKSAGGVLQSLLTLIIPSIPLFLLNPILKLFQWDDWSQWTLQKQISPVLGILILLIVTIWSYTVVSLSKLYDEKTQGTNDGDKSKTVFGRLLSRKTIIASIGIALLSVIYLLINHEYGFLNHQTLMPAIKILAISVAYISINLACMYCIYLTKNKKTTTSDNIKNDNGAETASQSNDSEDKSCNVSIESNSDTRDAKNTQGNNES